MRSKSNIENIIVAWGLAGIIGTFLTIVSDLILLGKSNSALSFLKTGTESIASFPQWRITIGTFLGIVVLPFQIAGLVSVYYGLKPAGKNISLIITITFAHALIMGVAFHASYAFLVSGWKLYFKIGPGNIFALEIVQRFSYYWNVIAVIMLVELSSSSIGYALIILIKKTLYPKWMFILNPLCIYLIMFLMVFAIPAPVGGFVAPAYLNLSTMGFMIFSTTIIYKKYKKQVELECFISEN